MIFGARGGPFPEIPSAARNPYCYPNTQVAICIPHLRFGISEKALSHSICRCSAALVAHHFHRPDRTRTHVHAGPIHSVCAPGLRRPEPITLLVVNHIVDTFRG